MQFLPYIYFSLEILLYEHLKIRKEIPVFDIHLKDIPSGFFSFGCLEFANFEVLGSDGNAYGTVTTKLLHTLCISGPGQFASQFPKGMSSILCGPRYFLNGNFSSSTNPLNSGTLNSIMLDHETARNEREVLERIRGSHSRKVEDDPSQESEALPSRGRAESLNPSSSTPVSQSSSIHDEHGADSSPSPRAPKRKGTIGEIFKKRKGKDKEELSLGDEAMTPSPSSSPKVRPSKVAPSPKAKVSASPKSSVSSLPTSSVPSFTLPDPSLPLNLDETPIGQPARLRVGRSRSNTKDRVTIIPSSSAPSTPSSSSSSSSSSIPVGLPPNKAAPLLQPLSSALPVGKQPSHISDPNDISMYYVPTSSGPHVIQVRLNGEQLKCFPVLIHDLAVEFAKPIDHEVPTGALTYFEAFFVDAVTKERYSFP
jgi:hypothetical protein